MRQLGLLGLCVALNACAEAVNPLKGPNFMAVGVAATGAPPIGAAGGHLAGTYPNPVLNTAIAHTWTASNATDTMLSVIPHASQSVNLALIGPAGVADSASALTVAASSAGRKVIVAKAFSGQTANIQEWQNSSGTALVFIASSGTMGFASDTTRANSNGLITATGKQFAFSSTSTASGSADAGLVRVAAGSVKVTNGSTGLGELTAAAQVTQTANTAALNLKSISESVTVDAAASSDSAANLLPANAFIVGVVCRVTTLIPTAATFDLGDAATVARFSDDVPASANSTGSSFKLATPLAPFMQSSAAKIRITPNAVPGDATGRVRVTVFYYDLTEPAS